VGNPASEPIVLAVLGFKRDEREDDRDDLEQDGLFHEA